MQIKNISINERPRERARAFGAESMSNAELLAIVIGSGTKESNALDLANELISHVGGHLASLPKMTQQEYETIKGIGPAKSAILSACFELGKRTKSEIKTHSKISTSRLAFESIKMKFDGESCEASWLLFLDRSNQVIQKKKLSVGGVSSTVVDVKVLVKMAIGHLASGVILAHNHPSGNLKPSESDIRLTKKVKAALSYCDINLLDHLIVFGDQYFSFADENIL